VILDEAGLGEYLDQAQHELFRLEVLDAYEVESDGGDFSRYLSGEPGPDPARKEPWLQRLRADAARGFRNYRVHVLTSPLSPYLRYECEWGYAPNAEAGEDIRILDLAKTPTPAQLIFEDFWLMDNRTMVLMRYDEGRFARAEVLPDGVLSRYQVARDAAWGAAEPFAAYWAAHPEFRRDGGAVA
jgi:hypothetical protein